MANFTKVYTLAFENNNQAVDFPIIEYLRKIELLMDTDRAKVVRRINGKVIRVHKYYWNEMNDDFVVVPFGKLKQTNKPLGMDEVSQKLVDIDEDMYDVTSLAYHKRFRVALLTTNQAGPSEDDIENYLNSYLPADSAYKLRLRPVKQSVGLEKVRNATEARSLTVTLDLGRPLNDFFSSEVHEGMNVDSFLLNFLNYSKNTMESKTFSITLGMGRSRKESLDLSALLALLESINLDSSCIKEIYVNYKDNTSTKVDTARLKENMSIVKIYFDIQGSQIAAEYLKNNLEERMQAERNKYYAPVQHYFSNAITPVDQYSFLTDFDEGPVA